MCIARIALFLTGFILSISAVHAFEVEAQKTYSTPAGTETLRILSTADIDVFEPIIMEFQRLNPSINIEYVVSSSAQLMKAIYTEAATFDLAISSAMDLQTKLANDGFAQLYSSDATATLPSWAKWRNQIFGFTQEPAVLVISETAFADIPIPSTREELIEVLRDHPDHFKGRIGTYDVRTAGLGYLFATQDSRNTESFWRLTEVMGRLDTKLYCCSGGMITDIAEGKLALAYNVLGSYAVSRQLDTPGIRVIPLDDFLGVMLRTALIPQEAKNPAGGGKMIDFLVTLGTRPELTAKTGLPPISAEMANIGTGARPIRLGPGLLVFLDTMRRETFLRSWMNSIVQEQRF